MKCTLKHSHQTMKKIFFAAALAGAAMLASCGGNKGGIKMGSLSDFDSLSYAIGANVGYGLNYQMKDIPFDYEAMDKGIKEGALGKSSQEIEDFLLADQKLWINAGAHYGKEGDSFIRINIACPRTVLKDGLQRLHKGLCNISETSL